MPKTNSNLERAATHLDATTLRDGRWAHYAAETRTWYVVTSAELEELCDYLDNDDETISGDAYSHWCAGTAGEEMPEGWTPNNADEYVTVEEMPDHLRQNHRNARNWGAYPANGAIRRLVHSDEADGIVASDADGYDHIVEPAPLKNTVQSRTVTICVGTDPTFIGSDATNTELLQWAERVCFAAGEKFDCDVVLLQRNDVGAVDCDDPAVRSWLRLISQGDEWMQYL